MLLFIGLSVEVSRFQWKVIDIWVRFLESVFAGDHWPNDPFDDSSQLPVLFRGIVANDWLVY
jgi:hypothetical protein